VTPHVIFITENFRLLLWRYSPTWALAYSILRLQASLSSADLLLLFFHFNILLWSLSTASIHFPLGLPTGLLPSMYPLKCFLRRPFVLHPQQVPRQLQLVKILHGAVYMSNNIQNCIVVCFGLRLFGQRTVSRYFAILNCS
jgi:hypothetical protein